MKQNYYFTFGQIYRHDQHPLYPKAHPDGWVRIIAMSEADARDKAFNLFGTQFGSSYSETRFNKSYFPAGEIECFEV